MNSYKKTFKKMDSIVLYDELENRNRCTLLEIKKDVMYGKIDYSNCLVNSEIISLYRYYYTNIARWLNIPEEEIQTKISNQFFTEVENKLIITNILIMENIHDDGKNYMDTVSM